MMIQANHTNATAKKQDEFRVYDEQTSEPRVVQHYKDMRRFQTVDFYRKMEQKYSFDNGTYRRLMTMEEALDELENYIVSVTCTREKESCVRVAVGTNEAGYFSS